MQKKKERKGSKYTGVQTQLDKYLPLLNITPKKENVNLQIFCKGNCMIAKRILLI